MNNTKDDRGFTLMEMVVVLAVIAILAAILTPIINSYVDRARTNAAVKDVKSIATAFVQFNTDAKFWPIYSGTTAPTNPNTATAFDYMATEGDNAALNGTGWSALTTTTGSLDTFLNTNNYNLSTNSGSRQYHGNFMTLTRDPWGTRYYVTSGNLVPTSGNAAYVVSAGPNQAIDTAFSQSSTAAFSVSGDDIVSRIK